MRDRGHTTRPARAALASLVALLLAALGASPLVAPAQARVKAYVPPHHRVFHGVSDTTLVSDFAAFSQQVGAHPALLEDFYHWGTPLGTPGGALERWAQTRTRGVLSLSTAPGGEPELISPGAIAKGRGDDYLLSLNRTIAASGQVVYIRLFPEMNGYWNPYCAFNADGTRRGSNHTTRAFVRAWRRVVIVVRGGRLATINRKLRHLGMPRLLRAPSNRSPVYARAGVPDPLPHPRVAFVWTPQTTGSPALRANAPGRYWPGRRYVDWVGADIYAKYATRSAFRKLTRFYRHHRRWPFAIGEYSPWDADPQGRFVRHLFRWAKEHRRTRMLIYYRSVNANSAFDIWRYPAARGALRRILSSHRFMKFPPGT